MMGKLLSWMRPKNPLSIASTQPWQKIAKYLDESHEHPACSHVWLLSQSVDVPLAHVHVLNFSSLASS